MSARLRWPRSISIHLSPRPVAAGVRPFPLAMQHFYSFVSQVCLHFSPTSVAAGVRLFRWRCNISIHLSPRSWCLPFSAGDATFLFTCLPGLSLVVSALFCWPCSVSIHLSPRSVTFPLAVQHFFCICLQVCRCWRPPFPLAM